MRKRFFLGITSLLLLMGALFVTPSVHAADANKVITLTPSTTKPVLNPGETKTGSFQIINQGDLRYHIEIYASPYYVKGENYDPDFTAIPGRQSAADWIRFDTTTGHVNKDENYTVHYTISVPQSAKPGGYYAVAFAQTKSDGSSQGVVVNERVGEIFYIQVAGQVHQAGTVHSWTSNFLQAAPLTADLKLENGGGTHYQSDIQLAVKDLFGNTKYSLNTAKMVLPQTVRHTELQWKDGPSFGLFKVTGSVTLPASKQPVTLATKYVFVASKSVRIVGCLVLVVILAFPLLLVAIKKRHKV